MDVRMTDGTFLDWLLSGAAHATAPSAGTPTPKATLKLALTNGANKYLYITLTNAHAVQWKGTGQSGQAVMENITFSATSASGSERTV
jgi:hypothetical protein